MRFEPSRNWRIQTFVASLHAMIVAFAVLLSSLGLSQNLRLVPQIGHASIVLSVAFSGDGRTLVSGGEDETICLWDVATRNELRSLRGHVGKVSSVCISPDGHLIASGSLDGSIRLWDADTGRERFKIAGFSKEIKSVSFSPDGRTLASGSNENAVRIWDVATGRHLVKFTGHSGEVRSVCFSPDGRFVASGSDDHSIRIWDVSSRHVLKKFAGHLGEVYSVCFSRDGRRLASGGQDKTVRLWDVESGRELVKFTGHSGEVNSVCFAPNGHELASGSDDKTIRFWNTDTRRETLSLAVKTSRPISLCFSPDGRVLASGCEDGILLWNARSGRQLSTIDGQSEEVRSISISRDAQFLASGCFDATIHLWDLAQGRKPRVLTGHFKQVDSVCFSPAGKILASGSEDKTIRIWDVATGRELRKFTGHSGDVRSICFSPDGRTLASGGWDNTIRIWNVATGHTLRIFKGHTSWVESICFSPDGRKLASGSYDKTILIWEVSTGSKLHKLVGHTSWINRVVFSPDGRTLASGSFDNTIRLWDVNTGRELRKLAGHSKQVESVCFPHDGRTLASGSDDGTLRIWDVASGRQLRSVELNSGAIETTLFSNDGRMLICGCEDGTICFRDSKTAVPLATLIALTGESWTVIDSGGRYDGSNQGKVDGLHWVYDDLKNHRMEPIELGQFASFYYTPGLLAKIWKREELHKVPKLQDIALYPEVKNLEVQGSIVKAELIDRGGGFGDIHIVVNGIDVKTVPGAATLSVDLGEKLVGLKSPDVRIYAYNAQKTIHSRATAVNEVDEVEQPTKTPKLVAVVGGVQTYANPGLNLAYADADALSVTKALLAMAKGLGAEIRIELVCDDPSAKSLAAPNVALHVANKAGFEAAFSNATKIADENTAFVVFLAGHGAALARDGGRANEYFYLTKDAADGSPTSLGNPEIAKQWAVSGTEIKDYLSRALACRRRFVVLDTCSAGASKDQFLALRGELEDQARARKEFQHGTGTFALMGAADGKSSLEAAEYGHGLLTYALLSTLKNEKLGDDQSRDTVLVDKLVARTQSVTRDIAQAIGRGQEPVAVAPDAGVVVLGRMDDAARASIQLNRRLPLLLRPSLTNVATSEIALGEELGEHLRETSLRGRNGVGNTAFAAYLDQDAAPDAYRLQGTYKESNGTITVDAKVFRNKKPERKPFPTVTGKRSEIIARLAEALKRWLNP